MKRLECPLCDFTILSKDGYFLQLHFEQAHTTDSPFIIQDDPEPLRSSLPPTPASTGNNDEQTPSSSGSCESDSDSDLDSDDSDQEERAIKSSASNSYELVSPSEHDGHIDYCRIETLSFDETTPKCHSKRSSATMHSSSSTHRSHRRRTTSTSVEHNTKNETRTALKRTDGHSRRSAKNGPRRRRNTNDSDNTTISRSILGFSPFTKSHKNAKPPSKNARLDASLLPFAKSDLGEYAFEERMPEWLHRQLSAGPEITIVNRIGGDGRLIKHEQVQNETPGIIPVLAQLSALDRTVQQAYYCHPSTIHVGKTPHEGGFCGYRNIHMLLSYIQGAKAQGHEEFPGRLPTILKLQDLIEEAWDNGINSIGRVQTGGIRNTRKYIGTPEAQAFFLNAEINCAVEVFFTTEDRKTLAHRTLLTAVERYFAQAATDDGSTVCKTLLPPIYLQQPGHSLTIVGFERHYDGTCHLVVFDPMYHTTPAMHKLLGRKNIKTARPEVLHTYRRGSRKLRKFKAFEILMLTATPPLFPAWDVLRQFPDCRFVYVFFRARSLGYDVYPEDHFLPTFPWQQYGGLWSCDDARFARADPMNALTSQALRRITGLGSSVDSSNGSSPRSPTSFFTCSSSPHTLATEYDGLPSWGLALDGTVNSFTNSSQPTGSGAVFNMGPVSTILPQPTAVKPYLSLLTEVGRKYPGFPTPLSPTTSAKDLFPSPTSNPSIMSGTPRILSSTITPASPMSIDGSEMCGPSHRYESHGYEHYASQLDSIDRILNKQIRSLPRTPSASHRSIASPPLSPSHCISPDNPPLHFPRNPTLPSIPIANGTEYETPSPLSPSGTRLSYTSNRNVSSGLLAVPPLSEHQVAEYRFWRPCGRRNCGFGCGGQDVGEVAAAKRLFRDVEDVVEEGSKRVRSGFELDGQGDAREEGGKSSVWAGRRLVTDWSSFLRGCEREGVAPV
ncbi:hypothetical protein GGP41_007674 [Bipolaris sorokiniana]|uniref:UFSP1/2/DUB catalytic domain-containing protein n=1 Tax=Cochliobolus sativus TaxID=45130 RepID=A0A8H5Z6X5_COCSA|nr:hypothetical protein GGP41_007674 [Bipolaris sorokiniana]